MRGFAAQDMPSAWTWCGSGFGMVSATGCNGVATCADGVKKMASITSAGECSNAADELLRLNSTVTLLNHKGVPSGCLVDQTRSYFNNYSTSGSVSQYPFLTSLCRLKNISALHPLNETLIACGKKRQVPVYRISAEDLENTLDRLLKGNVRKFALLLGPGTARLTKRLTIKASGLEIVLAGEPHDLWEVTRPPTATELRTKIDLTQHSIIVSGSGEAEASVCLQDLRVLDGENRNGGAVQVINKRQEGLSEPAGLHVKATRCVFDSSQAILDGGGIQIFGASLHMELCVLNKLHAGQVDPD